MKRQPRSSGFSLIEVNMAIFVMAIGVLSMVVLYPLGMRESRQSQDDLQQAMLADSVLNQLVAALSHPNITWSRWKTVPEYEKTQDSQKPEAKTYINNVLSGIPGVTLNLPQETDTKNPQLNHRVYCHRVLGTSGKIIGLQVDFVRRLRSKDETVQSYYAEVMFQGTP